MELPKEIGYDVCGIREKGTSITAREGRPKTYYITHHHLDHLPAFGDLTLKCPKPLISRLKTDYLSVPQNYEVCESVETYQLDKNLMSGEVFATPTYLLFVKEIDGVVIPECVNPLDLAREYASKNAIVAFRQPMRHPKSQRITVDELLNYYNHAFLADPRIWHTEDPKIIPKCIASINDVLRRPEFFTESPFSKRFRTTI
jgi:hypothetical protein